MISRRLYRIPISLFKYSGLYLNQRLLTLYPVSEFHTCRRLCKENDNKKSTHLGSIHMDKPMLMIAFTCKRCDTRSSHTMSKQAYTKGTVLIQCPGCKNRHLIADHLKIFNDTNITIQDIMHSQGESVSLSTEDLVFEDIPDSLKHLIGHHAKDRPKTMKDNVISDEVCGLPCSEKNEE